MSNGHACCLLGVCCPAGSESQRTVLAAALVKAAGTVPTTDAGTTQARAHADFILDNFDLAPKGSLKDLTATIAKIAREHPE